ncbi:MAG: TonB-dependent receptor, partial [Gemmatimonadetes bacterium]|nr:TonB-dependent receptor [Gemmatimonadota bacterium]
DDDRAGAFRSPAYSLVDVRAGWEGVRVGGARVTPSFGIQNLLDERYNASVVINAFGRRFYEPGPGRSLYTGVSLALGGDGSRFADPRPARNDHPASRRPR